MTCSVVPSRAGTLGRAGVHPAPQPDPRPPGQAAAPPAPHILAKVSLKLQGTAIKHKGRGSWAFEADMQTGGAGRPRVALAAL